MSKFFIVALLLVSGFAHADTMPGMDMSAQPDDSPATKEFKSGMATMDRGMGHYSGNTDQDFVVNMIPHHQGAVAMARTELKYGTDPKLKQLAQGIIAAQDKEIAFMKGWLAQHPAQ